MSKLVDTDELYAAFRLDIMGGLNYDRILREAKPVDAVPVRHGRWIHHKGGYSDHYECTACGKPIVLTAKWDFCPNCGADMRGEHEKAD